MTVATGTDQEIASKTHAHVLTRFKQSDKHTAMEIAYNYFLHDADAVNRALELAVAEHKPKGIGD
ncbi:hypothetical protein BBD42_12965 [Paenibacillus sp. BIHB 4019]|uniref:Uncharacterized protein n=1 Tax=Paenibacillus sp. BIHB 4019 TaxID=1870819 RepID=A0A1B2DHV1_9BACL|nr:hypothetical protein [Paenibacillus sp. BIHB 4019]ANY67281.1 hypothetical protein BBD42_12965 [Paenibacillus sp. BIHB 4019]